MRSLHGAPPTMLGDDRGGHIDWFGSDGTTIAWGERGGLDLYTGTYDGALHGTFVRTLTTGGGGIVGGGYLVRIEADAAPGSYAVAVYRLSDGLRARVDLEGSRGYPILLVASDEIVFGSPSGSDVLADLHRIDPRTLTFS